MEKSYRTHFTSLTLTKIANGSIDLKLVIAWLLNAIGSPRFLVGILMPVRESGSLSPQLLLARLIQKSEIGKYFWAVDVDASRSNRTAEVGAMRKMIYRTEERFGLKPDWIAADTAYGSSDNLVWLALKRKILPFIPVFDKGERTDGTFSRSDFTWGDENDRYICPSVKRFRANRVTRQSGAFGSSCLPCFIIQPFAEVLWVLASVRGQRNSMPT